MKSFLLIIFLLAIAFVLYIFANPSVYYAVSDKISGHIQSVKENKNLSWLGDIFSNKENQTVSYTPILMYHHVKNHTENDDEVEKGLSVQIDNFKSQMNYLYQNSYKSISLDQLFSDGGQKNVVITFDDGYKDVYKNAYPVMKQYGLTGTIFMIADFVGKERYLSWNELKELNSAGWQIESHTLSHPNLTNVSEEEAWDQIYESKSEIEKNIGRIVTFLSYPAGQYDKEIIELTQKASYTGAVGTDKGVENSIDGIYHLKRERVGGYSSLNDFIGLLE